MNRNNNVVTGEKASAMVGGQYNMVLIAAARAREIAAERRKVEQDRVSIKYFQGPCSTALTEIEEGIVGKEYLRKITKR